MASLADDGRPIALAVGVARIGLGIGTLLTPQGAMKAMLFDETNETGHAVARLVGARDLALGLAARNPSTRQAGIGGVLFAGSAAVLCGWAARRLS